MLSLSDGLAEFNSKRSYDGPNGSIDWLSDNVVHPLVNAALVDPINTVVYAAADLTGERIRLPELKPLQVSRSEQVYSPAWFVQSAMSGLGSFVPFVISGKLAGKVLRSAAAALELEGRGGALLASDRLAQLSGAGVYAGLKRPGAGESRFGNAFGTVAAFYVFEAGNAFAENSIVPSSARLSLLSSSALRLSTGFAGGALQVQVSSVITDRQFATTSKTLESAASGAFLNLGLGAFHTAVKDSEARANEVTSSLIPAASEQKVASDLREIQRSSSPISVLPRELASNQARRASLSGLNETLGNSSSKVSQLPVNVSKFSNSNDAAQNSQIEGGGVVYIVIDSGFASESLPPQENILGTWDPTGKGVFNDPLHHGSEVLSRLRAGDPNAKFMLIRAYDGEGNQASTKFEQGEITHPGWTEAYLEAVALADKLNLPSVANCSFGEFAHAMDGTGWQSFQLSKAIGVGKPGHVVVAASGPGDASPRHASGIVESARADVVSVSQNGEASFNLWMGKDAPKDWNLSVYQGDRQIYQVDGTRLEPNFWNNRQQVTFRSEISGEPVRFELARLGADARPLQFDFWIQEGQASFLDHLNKTLISEPAVFSDVVAVGLKDGIYAPDQQSLGHKPNVLVPGEGPISFRTPEVTVAIGKMLRADPTLDAPQIQKLLGKFPLGATATSSE